MIDEANVKIKELTKDDPSSQVSMVIEEVGGGTAGGPNTSEHRILMQGTVFNNGDAPTTARLESIAIHAADGTVLAGEFLREEAGWHSMGEGKSRTVFSGGNFYDTLMTLVKGAPRTGYLIARIPRVASKEDMVSLIMHGSIVIKYRDGFDKIGVWKTPKVDKITQTPHPADMPVIPGIPHQRTAPTNAP
jgi:hypothetical protein